MLSEKRSLAPAPAARRGKLGFHWHMAQAPMDVLSACAITPAASAQYPHPAQPKRIEIITETIRARMSLIEIAEKRIARFRSARCKTDVLPTRIVGDIAKTTCATSGSWNQCATSGPEAAKASVSRRPCPRLIQNR